MKKIITEKEEQTQTKPKQSDEQDNDERDDNNKENNAETHVDDGSDAIDTGDGDDEATQGLEDNYFRSDFHAREQARMKQRDSFFQDFFHNNDQHKKRDSAKQQQ